MAWSCAVAWQAESLMTRVKFLKLTQVGTDCLGLSSDLLYICSVALVHTHMFIKAQMKRCFLKLGSSRRRKSRARTVAQRQSAPPALTSQREDLGQVPTAPGAEAW